MTKIDEFYDIYDILSNFMAFYDKNQKFIISKTFMTRASPALTRRRSRFRSAQEFPAFLHEPMVLFTRPVWVVKCQAGPDQVEAGVDVHRTGIAE